MGSPDVCCLYDYVNGDIWSHSGNREKLPSQNSITQVLLHHGVPFGAQGSPAGRGSSAGSSEVAGPHLVERDLQGMTQCSCRVIKNISVLLFFLLKKTMTTAALLVSPTVCFF